MVLTIFTELEEVGNDDDDDDKEVKVSIIEQFPNISLVSLIILGCFLYIDSRFDATVETSEVAVASVAAVVTVVLLSS